MRRALLAILQPTMANLSVLALTSMPLLLVGLLLGGLTPINAFALMLFMVIGCISASVLVLGFAILLADKLGLSSE
jgi:putative ABC transport system permease protein